MKKYRLYAHGYEMVVSQDQAGKWWGFLRKEGDSGLMPAVIASDDLTETKLALCRQAETLAIVYGQSAVDACTESLPMWKEI
jgi:hypothetical protein